MIALLGLAAALADEPDPDLRAERVLQAPKQAIHEQIVNLEKLEQAIPESCAERWVHGDRSKGVGAEARLTYVAGPMLRRLDARVAIAEPNRVELVHPGRRGFITQYRLEEVDEGTRVRIHTPLKPPPWPFRRMFYNRVQPAWQDCHEQILDGLEENAG